ncbi:MAG TPA: M23 family metallopeptidase [Puia sp.]|nr:M23 family metallopeptidase [Puia sp.]
MKRLFAVPVFLMIGSQLLSQFFPAKNYPKNYFRNPLGIPIKLAANFGELRANHYHMGLDIRTEKRVNLPVYAAADGYIARIKIEPWGFGQAIYINHPNGYTTLYAHLNSFFPALAEYVKQQQYKMESWQVFLDIPPGKFSVRKGDLIALSGSTGGSEGPHLHFEIRRTADDVNLNPLLFGLPVPDNTPPVIQRLALYDRSKSVYEQSPKIFPARKAGAGYSIGTPLISSPSAYIGFAIGGFDTQSGSTNPNGIYEATLYDNAKPVAGFQMDNISYEDTRNINAHIDYKTRANGGPYLQQLFKLPGYTHSIYKNESGDGSIDISDGSIHRIRIEVKDAYGNRSELNCKIQYSQNDSGTLSYPGKLFYPGMWDGYETDDCEFYLGEKSLYDSVHVQYTRVNSAASDVVSAVHNIGFAYIPLQDSLLVRIKLTAALSESQKDKVVMQRFAGDKTEIRKPQWLGDWASASFRDFGNFQLVLDEEAPVIVPVGFKDGAILNNASRIEFVIKDNLDEYKNFRAELDGKWLMFTNDKGRAFIYKMDEHCPPGAHELKVSVEDIAGNKTEQIFKFTR